MLTVKRGTTSIGSIVGHGVLTAKIPTAGIYWIEVRARNNSWSGSYAFELDRLNDPVSGDRTAFGWNMTGAIRDWADFRCYQIRAARGAKAKLSLASSADRLYAEILDASGKRLCVVVGHGGSVCTFPKDGIYVVFVAARNWTWIGGFGVSVICQTLPCDCAAYSGNYGRGWPGKSGVPKLTTSAAPRLGATVIVNVGSSTTTPTPALLLIGLQPANVKPTNTGTLLVDPAGILPILTLSGNGLRVPLAIPNDQFLCGVGIALQSLVADPAAKGGFAFSRGLQLSLGR